MSQPGRGTGRLTSIGPYTLLDRIGSGGMGVVYRALDRRSGTVVAFKLLHEHVASDPGAVERFRREAHVASLLRSSYAVHTLDFGSDDGRYYLVSEYVEGRSLADVLAEGRPEPLAAIAIVTQAALALDEAHSREVTHRDIKPDNILLTEDGSVKLADFGIASLSYLEGLTQAGSYIGTIAYSAPEQHRGEADIRSDIYSLGVVTYEMLAGKRPFEAATATELMRMHAEVPLPLEPLAALPDGVVAVVKRCLEKDPLRRYQRPSELLADLNKARAAVAGPGASESWMEAAVAGLTATGVQPLAPLPPPGIPKLPAPEPETLESPPAATNIGSAWAAPAETRIEAPAPAIAGGGARKPPGRALLLGAAAAGVALLAGVAAVFAFSGGDDDDPPADGGGSDATRTAAAAGAGTRTATPSTTAPSASASPGASATTAPGETPAPGKTATVPGGIATFAPVSPTQGVAPTATSAPQPTNTPVPPTPTSVPASFSSPVFATTLTQSGLPPAGGVSSGGTITGACPSSIWAYVTHQNVAVGTQLTGTWTFQGNSSSNPTFGTNQVDGATNYQYSRNPNLLAGTYSFVLRAGLSQVTSGTVTIAC